MVLCKAGFVVGQYGGVEIAQLVEASHDGFCRNVVNGFRGAWGIKLWPRVR